MIHGASTKLNDCRHCGPQFTTESTDSPGEVVMKIQRLPILFVVSAVMTLSGCGEGGKSTPPTGSALTSIVVNPANSKMTVDRSSPQQFSATGSYSDGSTKDLTASATWSSSNQYVATVSAA